MPPERGAVGKESRDERARLSEPEMWDRMYGAHPDDRFWPQPETRCSAFELDRIYRRFLPRRPGAQILEMGCGGSKWLPYFYKKFQYRVAGIDYTETGCRLALRNLERVGGTGDIFCRDFNQLGDEFRGAHDLVVSYGVVEHFAKPDTVLSTFADCLRDEGIVITYVPNFAGVMGRLLKRMNRPLYDTHHIFDLAALREFHRTAGMEVLHSCYLEWADFSVLPLERYPDVAQKILKNLIHGFNRVRLLVYRQFGLNIQSPYWCAAMIVLARKPRPAPAGDTDPGPRP